MDHDQELYTKGLITRKFGWILFAILALLAVVVAMVNWEAAAKHYVVELVATIIAVTAAVFWEHRFLRDEYEGEMRIKLAQALFLQKGTQQVLGRLNFVPILKHSLNELVGDSLGPTLFDTLLVGYLSGSYGYRPYFSYTIAFEDTPGSDSNYKVHQTLQYVRNETIPLGADKGVPSPAPLVLGFAFDQEVLERWIGESTWFYRELLVIDDATRKSFGTSENLKNFVKENLNLALTVKILGKPSLQTPSRITLSESKDGIVVEYEAQNDFFTYSESREERTIDIQLHLCMLQPRSVKRFLVTLPEPTLKPTITFSAASSMENVTAITFFTSRSLPREARAGLVHTISCDGWTVPRSGAIFVWN